MWFADEPYSMGSVDGFNVLGERQMVGLAVGWQELAIVLGAVLIVIPFIAGLTMFIVGLSTKRRGLWIAGLVLALIPVVMGLLGVAVVMFKLAR